MAGRLTSVEPKKTFAAYKSYSPSTKRKLCAPTASFFSSTSAVHLNPKVRPTDSEFITLYINIFFNTLTGMLMIRLMPMFLARGQTCWTLAKNLVSRIRKQLVPSTQMWCLLFPLREHSFSEFECLTYNIISRLSQQFLCFGLSYRT